MAARNRMSSRGPTLPAHEESQMWNDALSSLKQLPEVHGKATKVAAEANKTQRLLPNLGNGEEASADLLGRMENVYQEGVRIAEQQARHSTPRQSLMISILSKAKEKLEILAALRQATETLGEQKRKRKDGPADIQPSKTKKIKTYILSRMHIEISDEIRVGSQVAYHLPKAKQADAEWIQCNVIRITGEAPKFRYEVQDPEPDEHGNMSQTYKTYSANLILIPDDSSGLPQLPNGTMVLARYPETTTFYRAEVIATKRDGTCKLRFEGEEEIGKETDVERRLVLEV